MSKSYYYHKYCNFCKSRKKKIIFRLGDQNLVKCEKCGLAFLDKQRSDIENLYNENYYSYSDDNSVANFAQYEDLEFAIKKNFIFAYDYIDKIFKPGKTRILEIGSGFGYFAKHLPRHSVYEAVEVSNEAIKHLRSMKLPAYKGEVLTLKLKHKYDVIVAFDVIEHQIYLKEFIEKVHDMLKPGGVFIFTTPNFDSRLNKMFGKKAPTIQPLYHNYYLTEDWISNQIPNLGFRILSMKTTYISYLSIGQIILLGSFALPFLKHINLQGIATALKVNKKNIRFFRFGGINCIMQKAGKIS